MSRAASTDENLVSRIKESSGMGDETDIHALIRTGADESAEFYLVIFSQPHPEEDDATLLSERYFAAATEEWRDDTLLSNGISRRANDANALTDALIQGYARANTDSKREETAAPVVLDAGAEGTSGPTSKGEGTE